MDSTDSKFADGILAQAEKVIQRKVGERREQLRIEEGSRKADETMSFAMLASGIRIRKHMVYDGFYDTTFEDGLEAYRKVNRRFLPPKTEVLFYGRTITDLYIEFEVRKRVGQL